MSHASLYPPGPPLPPNRRVRSRKSRPDIVEAPEERVTLEPATMPLAEAPRARWKEGLRITAGVLVTVAAALGCVWGLLRYTRTSPRFAVRVIQVEGGSHRSPEDVARFAGIVRGQNIFTVDLESARAGVLNDPWIEQASLRRKLPQTICIDVVEREAAALVAVGPDVYLSTRQGELFKKPEPGDPYDLPVVTGTRPDDIVNDRAGTVATIKRALDVVAEYEHAGPAKNLPVQEVHVEDDGAIVLAVGRDAIQLRLGKGPYRQPIEQATRVLGELQNRRAQASIIFLDNDAHPERVVVRMR